MQLTRKMRVAGKALQQMRRSKSGIRPTAKMLAAREALARRLGEEKPLPCKARGDRITIGCSDVYMALLLQIEGYRRTRSGWLRRKRPDDFLPYRRVTVLKNTQNSSQVRVYSEKKSTKLEPFRTTFIPDDTVGLEPKVVRSVLECIEGPSRIALLEIAFDFPCGSGVDSAYVRGRALFGKSKPYSVGKRPGWDAWGSRKGAKFVRSYYKKEVVAHRVELQLQPSFLRQHGINEISDLPRLVKILPRHHIWFARLGDQKLNRAMMNAGLSPKKMQEIRDGVSARAGNLCETVKYLRRRAGLKNPRRLLAPLRTNQFVREALKEWAVSWARGLK